MKDRKDRESIAREAAFKSLTFDQIKFIQDNRFLMSRSEIADAISESVSKVRRAARFAGWKFERYKGSSSKKYSLSIISEVIAYYDVHGMPKTKKQFPDLKPRSIVERYGRGRHVRCKKWTIEEKIELLRMAGIVPKYKQAEYFSRPMANAGSIESIWSKFFRCRQVQVNGLPKWKALKFVKKDCPFIKTNLGNGITLFLWTDMTNNLREDCPPYVSNAITAMSEFQSTLFKNPRRDIEKIMKERG